MRKYLTILLLLISHLGISQNCKHPDEWGNYELNKVSWSPGLFNISHPIEDTIRVKVKVHVIYPKKSSDYITNEQIYSQIIATNKHFSEAKIELVLLKINHLYIEEENYKRFGITENNELIIKSATIDYDCYNIWLVSEIDSNDGGLNRQAYAYYPGASRVIDGMVVLQNAFGTTKDVKFYVNQGKITTHEFGHAFGLLHTFEGDKGGTECPEDGGCGLGYGDCCDDTPSHIRNQEVCEFGEENCYGENLDNVMMNFMNYTEQSCQSMFTLEQIYIMRNVILQLRSNVIADSTDKSIIPIEKKN